MTTEVITVGFLVMTGTTAVALLLNRRLVSRLRKHTRNMREMTEIFSEAQNFKTDVMTSLYTAAKVEERQTPAPYFAVYRDGVTHKVDIAHIYYNPADSADREYKRIHAEEVAEKLNERP